MFKEGRRYVRSTRNCEDLDFEVRLPVLLPKLAQKGETQVPRPKNSVEKKNAEN